VFLCCSLLLLLLVVARYVFGDEHVDDLQRQHRAELLLSHARLNELALSDRAVVVLVHLVECCLHENLLTRLVRVCLVDQQKQILDYLLKLFQRDCPVIVNVEDTEYLLEILLWRTIGHDIQDNHELTEVDVAILIGVVHSEYVSLQLFCVRPWIALLHLMWKLFLEILPSGCFCKNVLYWISTASRFMAVLRAMKSMSSSVRIDLPEREMIKQAKKC